MCMTGPLLCGNHALEKFPHIKPKSIIYSYKVLNGLYSVNQPKFKYSPNQYTVSSRRHQPLNKEEESSQTIFEGIHSFINIKNGLRLLDKTYKHLFLAKTYVSDFVACGKDNNSDIDTMISMSVSLSRISLFTPKNDMISRVLWTPTRNDVFVAKIIDTVPIDEITNETFDIKPYIQRRYENELAVDLEEFSKKYFLMM